MGQPPHAPPPDPAAEPALRIRAGDEQTYQRLATTAKLLGKGLEELAHAAMMLEVPDPARLGAEGADWPNFENCGLVLQGWARIILSNLPPAPAELARLVVPPSARRGLILPPGTARPSS